MSCGDGSNWATTKEIQITPLVLTLKQQSISHLPQLLWPRETILVLVSVKNVWSFSLRVKCQVITVAITITITITIIESKQHRYIHYVLVPNQGVGPLIF